MVESTSEWARYAVVTRLASQLGEQHPFGKKAMQKVIYLLQERSGVPLGFRYKFYTYGVFSPELAATIDAAETMEGIEADYDEYENSYRLRSGKNAREIETRGDEFLQRYNAAIDRIVAFARGRTGKQLELATTIVFVALADRDSAQEHLIERTCELKPKFGRETVRQQVQELREFGDLLP